MPVIKLDAIPSTNDFLKDLAASGPVDPFTVAVAETQTRGRGQAGAKWVSEPGKNLTFSIYIPDSVKNVRQLFGLNVAVALSVAESLDRLQVPRVSVKWPNDILSGNRKIAGILIENSIGGSVDSIIGIGINVNQRTFGDLPSATSIWLEKGTEASREDLMHAVVVSIQNKLQTPSGRDRLWDAYHARLYMKDKAAMFAKPDGARFMAVVRKVTDDGRLNLELENGSLRRFAVREISMVY